MTITTKRLTVAVTLWAAVFATLCLTHFSPFGLLNIVGFPFLLFVPGYLTVLLLKMGQQRGGVKLLLSLGLSMAELIFVALLGNYLLPFVGVGRPLDAPVLLIEIGLLVAGMLIALNVRAVKRSRQVIDEAWHIRRVLPSRLDKIFAAIPAAFVGLSIMGAMSLNNGGGNIFTVVMLVGLVAYLGALIYYVERLHTNTILIALFFAGLALLFMTSLRGWYITGHDIQHEFRLFQQAAEAGKWSMGVTKDAYNACLSITILPTIFYKLLDVQVFYVFKVLFQLIFALAPALVLLINRNFVSKRVALLATLYFISFPTFFSDMPMLNRQEIALMFAGIGLLVLFSREMPIAAKRFVFIAMGLGVVVSHYSTNYTMLALLAVCAIGLPVLRFLSHKIKPHRRFYRMFNLGVWRDKAKTIVTIPMVIALMAASFIWSVQLTNSSGQLSKVFFDTIAHIKQALGEGTPSADDYFSYTEVSKLNDQQKLYRYFEQLSIWGRQKNGPEMFYDPSTYNKYTFPVVLDNTVPLTPAGNLLTDIGLHIEKVNTFIRTYLARFLQLMILIGAAVILFSKRLKQSFSNDYRLIQAAGLTLIAGMLAFPVLLADYDLSRMLQQLLLVSGVAAVLGSMYLIPWVSQRIKFGVASLAVLVMLSVMTGVFTAALGGYKAQLHLFNGGVYYDLYYTHLEERAGAQWLNGVVEHAHDSDVQTDSIFIDRYTSFKVQNAVQQSLLDDVYPGLVRKDAYVLLGYTTVKKKQATAYYNGSLITYRYPVEFLDNNKNLLYDNGGSRVYK